MNSCFSKGALMAVVLGSVLGASKPATAAAEFRVVTSNAVDKCQAFTPGITNTIRNRARGAENVGSATVNVLCSFELNDATDVIGDTLPEVGNVEMTFDNPTAVAKTVKCTLLPGRPDQFGELVEKTLELAPNDATKTISFQDEFVALGLGVNCALPPGVVISHTRLEYRINFA